jgi:signal transduction histidine kinase
VQFAFRFFAARPAKVNLTALAGAGLGLCDTSRDPTIHRGKWKWICVLAILINAALAVETAEAKKILLLHSFGRDFLPWSEYAKEIRAELDRQFREPMDIYEVSLATARFTEGDLEGPFAEYLRSLFDSRKLDLVVTVGGPAAAFFQKHRQHISPTTPALFAGLEQRRVSLGQMTSHDIAVAEKVDFPGVIENILHVLPETENIVVVLGNSPIEKYWLEQLRTDFQPFANRVTFTWYNELSFEDMLKRSAALPPRSAIYFIVLSVDAVGLTHEGGKSVERLHAVANAPIFAFNDAFFGRGIVGGPLISTQEVGRKVAAVAVRILNGEAPSDMRIEPNQFGTPKFDWRELRRWNISEAILPRGSVIEFRIPTIFEQYKWYIIGGVALCLIQTIFIIALLLNRRRLERERTDRQRAESAARDFSERLISAQEDERSRLARELHDDVTQRLALLAIEAGRAHGRERNEATNTTMRTIREGLVKLSEDVHALSYQLHPSILDDLGLVEALKTECERFSRLEAIPVEVKIEEGFVAPTRQIALCLFRIVQEALQNVGRHARANHAEVSLQRLDDGFRICVRDNGVGFDPKRRRERPSLGLASMQQRIYLLGGELDVDSAPGHGTIVLAWVPAREESDESPARAFG